MDLRTGTSRDINLNQAPRFSGPITADTNDDDLQYLAQRNGYALGVPVQICAHLLKLERHILQLEQKTAARN